MALISTKDVIPKLRIENEGDITLFHHAEEVTSILKANKEDRLKGEKQKGDFRFIGRIPITLLLQHPEWLQDPKALLKFLQSSEGEECRRVQRI